MEWLRTRLMSFLWVEGRAARQWMTGMFTSPTMWRPQEMSLSCISCKVPSRVFWMGTMARSLRHWVTESVTRSMVSQATGWQSRRSSFAASEL